MSQDRHPAEHKTADTETRRLRDKMGLDADQARKLIRAVGPVAAVPAATLALRAERACGGLAAALDFLAGLDQKGYDICRTRLQACGVEWRVTSWFGEQLRGALVLMRATTRDTLQRPEIAGVNAGASS